MSLERIKNVMGSRVWPDNASLLQAQLADALWGEGFVVALEYPTKDLGDDRKGRIDLVVIWTEGGEQFTAAIELDCRRPRKRSLKKLRLWDGLRIIGLRGVEMRTVPKDIDAVVTMKVRVPGVYDRQNHPQIYRKKGK